MKLDGEDDNYATFLLFIQVNQMFFFILSGKYQQVALKQHLRMFINYGLTDVTKCLHGLGFEEKASFSPLSSTMNKLGYKRTSCTTLFCTC